MKALIAATTILCGIGIAGGAANATPVVVNGGFEKNTLSTQTNTEIAGQGGFGNFVTGWTVTGSNPYDIYFVSATTTANPNGLQTNARGQYQGSGVENLRANAVPDPKNGGNFVGLDGDSGIAGPISQTIGGFTIGQSYAVNFDWAASQLASRSGATSEQFSVSLAGVGGGATETHTTQVVNNPDSGFTGWFSSSLNFTATATSETLQFLSLGTPNGLPPIALLDNVSISNVPEPASLALIGAGLASFGLIRRRRA